MYITPAYSVESGQLLLRPIKWSIEKSDTSMASRLDSHTYKPPYTPYSRKSGTKSETLAILLTLNRVLDFRAHWIIWSTNLNLVIEALKIMDFYQLINSSK